MPCLEANNGFGGFPGAPACLGGFTTMVDGIAQQVSQGGFEALEDIPIHLGIFTDDFQADLFAERSAEVAHHAGKTLGAVDEGAHWGREHCQGKTMGQMGGAPVVKIELFHPFGEERLAFGYFSEDLMQTAFAFLGEVFLANDSAQIVEALRDFAVMPFQSLE